MKFVLKRVLIILLLFISSIDYKKSTRGACICFSTGFFSQYMSRSCWESPFAPEQDNACLGGVHFFVYCFCPSAGWVKFSTLRASCTYPSLAVPVYIYWFLWYHEVLKMQFMCYYFSVYHYFWATIRHVDIKVQMPFNITTKRTDCYVNFSLSQTVNQFHFNKGYAPIFTGVHVSATLTIFHKSEVHKIWPRVRRKNCDRLILKGLKIDSLN